MTTNKTLYTLPLCLLTFNTCPNIYTIYMYLTAYSTYIAIIISAKNYHGTLFIFTLFTSVTQITNKAY